ncbi:transcription mediator complex subunit Med12-domain-containing protein [Pholiota molesta]|nr:transcription mediator complex subunit Med12-domain-containing protein [Pholiota molesta]
MDIAYHLSSDIFFTEEEFRAPTFKIPTRVTLNDAKRQSWFADLANPDFPLYKLKSVPHGAKGHDLLDLLHSNNVAIPRAVWFLRVFGANETAGLRNKPAYVPTQYSIDWANVVTGYMRKQLIEIALPSAPRPGLNIKQTFKGVLADADTLAPLKLCVSLKLLRTFYAEDLVDHKTFLMWLVQQMTTCNLAQAGFLTRLTDEYINDIFSSRALARPLGEACLAKLSEIRTTSAHEFLKDTEDLLKVLLQRICLAFPDALVSPKMWSAYSVLLEEVMFANATKPLDDHSIA